MPSSAQTIPLGQALRQMLLHPLALLAGWNWKTGMFSAMIHGGVFFATNMRAGQHAATRASIVEFTYATLAAGVAGAVTQRLRHAVPIAGTAVVVWLGIPVAMVTLQATAHRLSGTPHMRTGLIASFIFAAFASGFNWFSMAKGAFVTGEERSFLRDLALVPKLIGQFLIAPFR